MKNESSSNRGHRLPAGGLVEQPKINPADTLAENLGKGLPKDARDVKRALDEIRKPK